MSKQRNLFIIDDKHDSVIGYFWDLKEDNKEKPPRIKLCTAEDLLYKITSKGKKGRSDTEQYNFVMKLYNEKLKRLLKQQEEKKIQPIVHQKVSSLVLLWLEQVQSSRSHNTYSICKKSLQRYLDFVGDHNINEFKPQYNTLLQKSLNASKKPLSSMTRYKISLTIQLFFHWAFENEFIEKPIKITKPIKEKKEPIIYTKEQLAEIHTYLAERYNKAAVRSAPLIRSQLRVFQMAIETGMRPGEIWALSLENIDLKNKKILIKNTTVLTKNGSTCWKVKGKREQSVPISDTLSQFLEDDLSSRNAKEKYYIDNGCGFNPYSDVKHLTRPFREINKILNIPKVKPLHGIRASVITYLLKDGNEVTWVQKLARHASVETTMGYLDSKVLPVEEMVNNLSSILESK